MQMRQRREREKIIVGREREREKIMGLCAYESTHQAFIVKVVNTTLTKLANKGMGECPVQMAFAILKLLKHFNKETNSERWTLLTLEKPLMGKAHSREVFIQVMKKA